MSETGSNWFAAETTLLDELRKLKPPAPAAPQIPGYEEVRELRRGGQGIVYTGVQKSTSRKVAIKVLLDSAADEAGRRRFEREIDLVASLRHPRIVSVYDSGVTAEGRRFLVMEYVEGLPFDEFLRERSWSGSAANARRVVELTAKVAEAIEHAHQRGVIHRDLKPSNIRVDAAGEPRVLDFGLAKPNAESREDQTLTISGQFLGSLGWASPEQATGETSTIDVRSDVYSLGVLLYHALTGVFPYDVSGGLRKTLDQIATAIPARPSRHQQWIDDELDTILLKCLSKDAVRRYQSAGELARDLRRYLSGEPVLAKADSAWYTIRATVRRHRGVFIGVSVLAGVLACSSIVLAAMYARARDAEALANKRAQEAIQARDEAKQQSDEKAAIAEFLRGMLSTPDPTVDGKDVKVVDVLDKAAKKLAEDRTMSTGVKGALEGTLAETYQALGRFDQAEAQYGALVEIRTKELGPDHFETLLARRSLAAARSQRGELRECEAILRDVVERAERLSPTDRARLNAHQSLGENYFFQARMPESEAELRRALADQQAAPDADPDKLPQVLATLAIALRNQSKNAEAVTLLEEALAGARQRYSRRSGLLVKILNSYASAVHSMDRFEDAERSYREALGLATEAVGDDHSDTITILSNLGQLYADRGRHEEGEPLMRRALEASKRTYGPLNPTTLLVMNNYAKMLQNLKRLDEAEPIMRDCVEGRIKVLGPDHPYTLIARANLASMIQARGRLDEALAIEHELLEIRLAKFGEKSFDTLISLNSVGMCTIKAGRPEEALPYLERCTKGSDALFGPEHSNSGTFRANYGRCLQKLERFAEAEPALRSALAVQSAKLGAKDARVKQTAGNLAEVLRALGREEEAKGVEGSIAETKP